MALTLLNTKDYFWNACTGLVSDDVLPNIPSKIPSGKNSFVVISTPTPLKDLTDYNTMELGGGIVNVMLFARDIKDGLFGDTENVALLNEMLENLRLGIESKKTQGVSVIEQGIYTPRTSYEGFHSIIVIYNFKIS